MKTKTNHTTSHRSRFLGSIIIIIVIAIILVGDHEDIPKAFVIRGFYLEPLTRDFLYHSFMDSNKHNKTTEFTIKI